MRIGKSGTTNSGEKMAILDNGNIGIGSGNPQYRLDVIGDIRATGSVYYGGTAGNANGTIYNKPDFVFREGYRVMATAEVAAFIQANKHLPWVTESSAEAANGINMTRMGFESLESLENLQMQIISLKAENDDLKARLDKLERLIQDKG
jgi:hypothetical protein